MNNDKKTNPYMLIAVEEAREGIRAGHGGPFGSVIVKGGKIVSQGHNLVLKDNDSTAHGEIVAIRRAEQTLGTYDLSGCELYTTGEPCPMCLAACKWANIDRVFYGCNIKDNAGIGFRDQMLDEMLGKREAFADYLEETDRDICLELFEEYRSIPDKQEY